MLIGGRKASQKHSLEAIERALEANEAYVAHLNTLQQSITSRQASMRNEISRIERVLALQRAQVSVQEFSPTQPSTTRISARRSSNSIRPHPSFFSDSHPRKRSKIRGDWEPEPNADTLLLQQHFHQAFRALHSRVFTKKEQACITSYVSQFLQNDSKRVRDRKEWKEITLLYPKLLVGRSPFACQLRYMLHDAPGLRLCAWTKEEDNGLKRLASGEEDLSIRNRWEEIASRLPFPGRPPVHCLIRYQTKLCASNLNSQFTSEEDQILRDGIAAFGERWNQIADLMDGRVAEQLRHRWHQTLSPHVRQGKFSIVEDRRLLLAMYAYHDPSALIQRNQVNWHEICHHVPGRGPPQLRDRFLNSLTPDITFRSWTKEEDAKLIQLVAENKDVDTGGLWSRIASQLGRRTDNQVARRWKYLAPLEHTRRQEMKKCKQILPAIFRRAIARKGKFNPKTRQQKRSSYIASLVIQAAPINTCRASKAIKHTPSKHQEQRPEHEELEKPTDRKALRCYRPKEWSKQAEEAFRLQQTGWRDLNEYTEAFGEPERWENSFISCTRVKSNGFYTYWRRARECEDKYLHQVKLYE
uniref:Uncharacterized protein AlNc14C37G3253 n=1 Tax=Albugo laibachii Nc14 TaxID=890382 RepID=F0W8X8_9STRA|nr:conserved hypothetical protein [Albugo laibachii Nc14]|eukprot:CCA17589.1 conserved hypothetical protein [Albugo laibachii Nc14]